MKNGWKWAKTRKKFLIFIKKVVEIEQKHAKRTENWSIVTKKICIKCQELIKNFEKILKNGWKWTKIIKLIIENHSKGSKNWTKTCKMHEKLIERHEKSRKLGRNWTEVWKKLLEIIKNWVKIRKIARKLILVIKKNCWESLKME